MNIPLYTIGKWAAAITSLTVLGGWMSSASVRLHKLEEQANQVPSMAHQIRVISIFMKLTDSTKHNLAEELAQ